MTTRLGLISDVHARHEPLEEALTLFKREHVDRVICAGDIAGYFEDLEACIELLREHDCATIIGNHDQAYIESHADEAEHEAFRYLDSLPQTLEFDIAGKRICVVHAHPPASQHGGIKLLDVDGRLIPGQKAYWQNQLQGIDCDVLIVGHTHQVLVEQLGDVLLINPGSTQFNHSCMILSLPEMTVTTHALEGKQPLLSWNWGKFMHDH